MDCDGWRSLAETGRELQAKQSELREWGGVFSVVCVYMFLGVQWWAALRFSMWTSIDLSVYWKVLVRRISLSVAWLLRQR